jgi:hypothetical protein
MVTRFEFALHPVGPKITAGLVVYPFDQARAVLQHYRDAVATMAPDLTVWAVLRKAPSLPFLAPQVHGQDVLVLPVFSPSPSDAVGDLRSGQSVPYQSENSAGVRYSCVRLTCCGFDGAAQAASAAKIHPRYVRIAHDRKLIARTRCAALSYTCLPGSILLLDY